MEAKERLQTIEKRWLNGEKLTNAEMAWLLAQLEMAFKKEGKWE